MLQMLQDDEITVKGSVNSVFFVLLTDWLFICFAVSNNGPCTHAPLFVCARAHLCTFL